MIKRYIEMNKLDGNNFSYMIIRVFSFIKNTVNSIYSLFNKTDDGDYNIQGLILARSVFEYSIRLLWAIRIDKGGYRYQLHWQQESIRWAEEVIKDKVTNLETYAKNLLTAEKENSIKTKSEGVLEGMPNMKQILNELYKKDIEENYLNASAGSFSLFYYFAVYRSLSRYVHGHISVLQTPNNDLSSIIPLVIVYSTESICRVIIHSCCNDQMKFLTVLRTKLDAVLKGND